MESIGPGSTGHGESADLDDLARRAASGDRAAMDSLLVEIEPMVQRICGRMLLHAQDAEEAAQDALLLVTTKIGTFHGRSRFSTWVYSVTANSARTTYRRLKRRAGEHPVETMAVDADPRTTSVIAGTRLDLLEALDTLESNHPGHVEPLVLRDVQGLDYDEIGQVLRLPVGTVKSRIHRARNEVRPLLRGHV